MRFTGLQNLSFRTKRIIAGFVLVMIVFAAANYYGLHWFGAADKPVRAVVFLLALVFLAGGGVNLEEIRQHQDRKRREQR